jgi:peptidoglycan lytic transglycosylase
MMRALVAALAFAVVAGCTHPDAEYPPPSPPPGASRGAPSAPAPSASPGPSAPAYEVGLATWYGGKLAGRKTASGERFDPSQMTAAHRTLPFGTRVEVTRADTGKSVIVRINDRGPFGDGARIIDLSREAAEKLGVVRMGVARVTLRVVD